MQQYFINQTEAFEGFRTIVAEREKLEEDDIENEGSIYLKEWSTNNDFLFLYNTKTDKIEGVRSFKNGLSPEKYLLESDYIPVSYTRMLAVLRRERASHDKGLSLKEEDEILENEIMKAVNSFKISGGNSRSLVSE